MTCADDPVPRARMPECNARALHALRELADEPELAGALWYRGVNLGAMLEYHLFPEFLQIPGDSHGVST